MKDTECPEVNLETGNLYWLNIIIRLAEVSKSMNVTERLYS
jgi:hypothetical protein